MCPTLTPVADDMKIEGEDFSGPATAPFEGVIGVEGLLTGDGRLIEESSLTWATFPLPLRWAAADFGAHDGAVIVGRIDRVERRENGDIYAWGVLDLGSKEGMETARLMRGQFLSGVSMDLDSVDSYEAQVQMFNEDGTPQDTPAGDVLVTSQARVRAATLVAIPAFDEARLSLIASLAAAPVGARAAVGHGAFSLTFATNDETDAAFTAGDALIERRARELAASLMEFSPKARALRELRSSVEEITGEPVTGTEREVLAADTATFAEGWRTQWRAPKGTNDAGQWIEMPGVAGLKIVGWLQENNSPRLVRCENVVEDIEEQTEKKNFTGRSGVQSLTQLLVDNYLEPELNEHPETVTPEVETAVDALRTFADTDPNTIDLAMEENEAGADTDEVDLGDFEDADWDEVDPEDAELIAENKAATSETTPEDPKLTEEETAELEEVEPVVDSALDGLNEETPQLSAEEGRKELVDLSMTLRNAVEDSFYDEDAGMTDDTLEASDFDDALRDFMYAAQDLSPEEALLKLAALREIAERNDFDTEPYDQAKAEIEMLLQQLERDSLGVPRAYSETERDAALTAAGYDTEALDGLGTWEQDGPSGDWELINSGGELLMTVSSRDGITSNGPETEKVTDTAEGTDRANAANDAKTAPEDVTAGGRNDVNLRPLELDDEYELRDELENPNTPLERKVAIEEELKARGLTILKPAVPGPYAELSDADLLKKLRGLLMRGGSASEIDALKAEAAARGLSVNGSQGLAPAGPAGIAGYDDPDFDYKFRGPDPEEDDADFFVATPDLGEAQPGYTVRNEAGYRVVHQEDGTWLATDPEGNELGSFPYYTDATKLINAGELKAENPTPSRVDNTPETPGPYAELDDADLLKRLKTSWLRGPASEASDLEAEVAKRGLKVWSTGTSAAAFSAERVERRAARKAALAALAIEDDCGCDELSTQGVVDFAVEPSTDNHEEFANWVEKTGGLPKYIRKVADHLIARGMTESHAIASAVNTIKRWARGGSAAKGKKSNVKPDTIAKAAAALAQWEAMKAAAKGLAADSTATFAQHKEENILETLIEGGVIEAGDSIVHVDGGIVDGQGEMQQAAPSEDVPTVLARTSRAHAGSLIASTGAQPIAPVAPPKDWFKDPGLHAATPVTVTPEGRVYGHLATWDSCHLDSKALGSSCTRAPRTSNNYSSFHLGALTTAEGDDIAVGRIIAGAPHADPVWSINPTVVHYSHSGWVGADVRVGEDRYGIWIAGAIRPDVSAAQLRALKASPLSGDWREEPKTGRLELVAALAVNSPGFGVPRPQALIASTGAVSSMQAVGMLPPRTVVKPGTEGAFSREDLAYLKERSAAAKSWSVEAAKIGDAARTQAVDRVTAFARERKMVELASTIKELR